MCERGWQSQALHWPPLPGPLCGPCLCSWPWAACVGWVTAMLSCCLPCCPHSSPLYAAPRLQDGSLARPGPEPTFLSPCTLLPGPLCSHTPQPFSTPASLCGHQHLGPPPWSSLQTTPSAFPHLFAFTTPPQKPSTCGITALLPAHGAAAFHSISGRGRRGEGRSGSQGPLMCPHSCPLREPSCPLWKKPFDKQESLANSICEKLK